eukprot:5687888-Prymnesium_polylepis.1
MRAGPQSAAAARIRACSGVEACTDRRELLSELNDGRPHHAQVRGHGGTRRPCRSPGPRWLVTWRAAGSPSAPRVLQPRSAAARTEHNP